jgi:hypothetical protein
MSPQMIDSVHDVQRAAGALRPLLRPAPSGAKPRARMRPPGA